MTIDPQSSKKPSKKHRNTSDDRKRKDRDNAVSYNDGLAIDEGAERKKKKRRERRVREGAIDVPCTEPKEEKRKKAKRDADSDPTSVAESRKRKKEKRKYDRVSVSDAAPSPASPKKSRVESSAAEAEDYLRTHNVSVHLPPDASALFPITSFDALPIPDRLRGAFAAFKEPTPIQACAWPVALSGKDVIGIAETGSGKTLAFGIPALARLHSSSPSSDTGSAAGKGKGPRALVLAPTRELALQTYDALSALDAVPCAAVFGGVDKTQQVCAVKRAQVVIGTPGRLLDLTRDGALTLGGVEYLVLDEADRMLDKGFENDIRGIIGYAKQGAARQTLMFSATWPEAVRRLANSFLRNPIRITVGSDDLTANSRIAQEVEVFDDEREKDQRLLVHLKKLAPKKNGGGPPARILVFVLYKKEAPRVESTLRRAGYAVGALHGDMTQQARLDALQHFRDGTTRLLVATDVAARGLDIPDVGCVLNYSFPLTIEDYVHRIGRTGRGGKDGRSITFFTGSNHERSLAGELARVLREGGVDVTSLSSKFPMSIKKKTHGVYGAFFREDVDMSAVPKRKVFED
ncbi:P-loop containing nucleoside triphosphate hydrolase protein [Russula compacta]|nr:P-loop containing nucleoside triphosphate hydrolase protein [Russula compacta]